MKGHWDYISRHYVLERENVWLYHVTYGKKKGLTVRIANGDILKSEREGGYTFFEYSNDLEYKYCNKVFIENNDGTERLDIAVLNERDDDKARRMLMQKYKDERDLIVAQYDEKLDGIYYYFTEVLNNGQDEI